MISSTKRFQFLDGLRGIAALIVVVYHFNNLLTHHSINPFPKLLNWIFNLGHCGVEIFFVLSGFVIAYSIRNDKITLPFVLNFGLRRSIRLDPPYWTILTLLLLFSLIGNAFKSTPVTLPSNNEIVNNFLYLADLAQVPRILPLSWTLSLEIQFYLFFIILVKFIQFLNNKNYSVIILCSLMLLSLLQNTPYSLFSLPGLFIYKWYSFLIGCLACWAMLNTIKPIVFWINFCFIGIFALFFSSLAWETCIISGIIYVVAIKGKMNEIFTNSFLQYLGKISYSLYLTHWIVGMKIIDIAVRLFGKTLENPLSVYLLFIFAFIISIILADIFYRFIELPCLSFSKKLGKKPVAALA